MQRNRLRPLLVCLLLATSCGPPRKAVQACTDAWGTRIGAVEKEAAELDALKTSNRRATADQAIVAAQSRLKGLTVPAREILLYPDQLKSHLATTRMKITSVDVERQGEPGTALRPVRYEIEAHGDYRLVPKLVQTFYAQSKAVFIDKLEVNIAEDTTRRSKVTAQVHLMALQEPASAVGPPPEFTAAVASAPPPLECIGIPVDKSLPERWASERAALAGRNAEATQLATLLAHEEDARTLTELAADLARKRDDNKAVYLSKTDELIQTARSSVTLDAVLKLKPNGDPLLE